MIRKRTTAYFLLLALEKVMEKGVPISDFLTNPGQFAWTGYRTNLNKSSLYKAIGKLKTQGYLLTVQEERKILIKLSETGKQEVFLNKLLSDNSWDNKWRVVIFDIPEKHRKLRKALRSKLKEWQFEKLQKSVWVSKKDIAPQLKEFVKEIGLQDWVKILIAEEFN